MSTTMIGTVVPYAGIVTSTTQFVSQGWLLCDGTEINRSKFSALFGIIGIMYGSGDNMNTFNLPNYQGMFLRGVSNNSGNDPDATERTNQQNANGGPGTSSGDEVGSVQDDQFRSHSHSYTAALNNSKNDIDNEGSDWPFAWNQNNLSTSDTGGNETRPVNVYVNYLICFQ